MKAYVKPDLVYENFELSDSIAVCGFDMSDMNSVETCTAEGDAAFGNAADGLALFLDANARCQFEPDRYCYQPGTTSPADRVFNS